MIAGIIPFLPLVLPLVVIGLVLHWGHRTVLYLLIWCLWLPRGKCALVVYSDSPIWRTYMIEEIMPLLKDRAVVLNWSERSRWRNTLAVRVFRSFRGAREFNPMVVLFRPFRRAKFFRFWAAFKSWKQGSTTDVDAIRDELQLNLNGG